MSTNFPIPETSVLAIASHVVYGYVGNKMATFVMQSLGCDVAGMNTVHFSNHTGYRQWRGTKTSASDLLDLYAGLKQSQLTDFDMLLSGYAPSAEAVNAIGQIACDLRDRHRHRNNHDGTTTTTTTTRRPGSFIWVLDPVMGDQGRLYVSPDVVPAYRALLGHADLILPNQFEAETLSGCEIGSLAALRGAVERLHRVFGVAHVVVTSVRFGGGVGIEEEEGGNTLSCVGSSRRGDGTPRLFRVDVPALDCFFSGTGDMFAALMVVRFKEAVIAAGVERVDGWVSGDEVLGEALPLARATEMVLASMQGVLEETMKSRNEEMQRWGEGSGESGGDGDAETAEGTDGHVERRYLAETKAAEVRVVRNVEMLRNPVVRFKAQAVDA